MSESFLESSRTLESFVSKKSKNSEYTRKNYECAFRHFEEKFLKNESNDRRLSQILDELRIVPKPQEALEDLMQRFIDWSESQNIPQKSIQNRMSVIIGYMKYQRIPFDKDEFFQNIEVKKSLSEKLKPITLDIIKAILENTSSFEKRVFYILIVSSGLRGSEALGLRIRDIDINYKRYLIHVSKEFAKGHKARDTICSKEVMPLLDKIMKGKQKEDFIFKHGSNIRNSVVNEDIIFNRCKKRAGIESEKHEITIHGLRAFFISAFEKNSSSFGHEFAGHSKYMDTYHRFTIEEKIEEYIKTEPNLSIYDKHEPLEELDEIKQKLILFDKLTKNPKFQKLLEELD